jgi:hypothetical protein
VAFAPTDPVGFDAEGRLLTIADLVRPGKMLALVVGAAGCSHCDDLKEEFAGSMDRFPYPLYLLSNEAQPASGSAHFLFDEQRRLHRHAEIAVTPSLLLIDPDTLVAGPAARGGTVIRQALLALLLQQCAAPERNDAALELVAA